MSAPPATPADVAPSQRRDADTLDDLTIAGALALILAAGAVGHRLPRESYEWLQFVLVGASLPLATILLARGTLPDGARRLVVAVGAAALVLYVVRVQRWIAVPLAIVQLAATAACTRARPRPADVVVALAAWSAATALGTSAKLMSVVARPELHWILLTAIGVAATSCSLALRRRAGTTRPERIAIALALGVLALESLRADDLFDPASVFHWGCLVGPAADVRQGGWLLWDVPAQYGFLSTLAIARFPVTSVWDAFFLVDALACFGTAALLFGVLRTRLHVPVALGVTLAAVLWLPGLHFSPRLMGGGVHVTPAAGPFRFFWCQALLALAALRPERAGALLLGSLVWLAGCFWSAESAVYCCCTWLPAYLLLIWPRGRRLFWLALPAALVAAAVVGVELWYVRALGERPDWYAFIEPSVSVAGGTLVLPIDPWQGVGVLVLGLWAVATAGVGVLRAGDGPRALVPLVAAYGALWSTASYFVGRSDEVNVTNLLPMVCLAGAVALREVRATPANAVRPALAAVLGGILLLALHTPQDWQPFPERPRWALSVDAQRPVLSEDQLRLMHAASISPGTPMILYDSNLIPRGRPDRRGGSPTTRGSRSPPSPRWRSCRGNGARSTWAASPRARMPAGG